MAATATRTSIILTRRIRGSLGTGMDLPRWRVACIVLARPIQVARRLGIASPLDINLSLALGTSDLSLLELTSAYGALANQGVWMPPVTIRYVTDAQGKLLEEHVPEGREALAPETAYVITHMLRGVVERGTGQAAKVLGRPV